MLWEATASEAALPPALVSLSNENVTLTVQ
jgi:hypothetical protein